MSFDLQTVCRCCLSVAEQTDRLQTIFDSHIFETFTQCTGLKPIQNDGLPAKICMQCVFKCISWESFKQLCERTESVLRTQLKTSESTKSVEEEDTFTICEKLSTVKCETQDMKNDVNKVVTTNSREIICLDNLEDREIRSFEANIVDVELQQIDSDHIHSEEELQQSMAANSSIQTRINDPKTCTTCGRYFDSIRSLYRHRHIHVVGRPYKCDQCERSYKFKSSLSLHSRVHRKDIERYVCDLCGKSFLRAHGLQSHMLSHSTALPFRCDLCPKRFKNEAMLRNHQSRHAPVKRFMCDECGKGFATGAELRTHSRKHTGLKPYQCVECPKSYKTRTHLTVHMRVHTGDRPYACEFCELKFAHKKVCEQHRMTHTGEKPHTCDICKRSFRQRHTLIIHSKTHKAS